MGLYVKNSGVWQELTGTDQPYSKVSGNWQSIKNVYAKVSGQWQQVYQYDNTAPTVPTPSVISNGSSDTISWGNISDDASGVAYATLYQSFYNVTDNIYEYYDSTPITTYANSTTMSIPVARRNTPTGKHYQVYYWISATDNAGNTVNGDQVGAYSPFVNTKPYGTYYFVPNAADSRNIGDTAWLNTTVEGILGYSGSRAYGCWFYGDNVFQTACKGWNANSGTLYIKRAASTDSNRGNSGTFFLQTHNLGAKGAYPATFVGTVLEQYLSGNSAAAYVNLDYTTITKLQDGSAQGFGLTYHTAPPGFLLGARDFSGLVTLNYS